MAEIRHSNPVDVLIEPKPPKASHLSNFVCKCFLLLLHRIYAVIVYLSAVINSYYQWWVSRHFSAETAASKLTKRPKHLAIALNAAESININISKLAEVINWCRISKIESLTVFHHSTKDLKPLDRQFDDFTVAFVSRDSSHHSLVETCREFARNKSQITPATISDELRKKKRCAYSTPDPDLLLSFNDRLFLNAFPLWQIRLTEIEFMRNSFKQLTAKQFFDKLNLYSNCSQRFGR